MGYVMIEEANPYGELSVGELLALEAAIGGELPAGYRRYLERYNGGNFVKRFFKVPTSEVEFLEIRYMYGLHSCPSSGILEQMAA
jgi:hypothetical protein